MGDRIAAWWDRVSPLAALRRAREAERARRAAALARLESIPLASADRVAALLLGRQPIGAREIAPSAPDPYTTAFLEQNASAMTGLAGEWTFDRDARDGQADGLGLRGWTIVAVDSRSFDVSLVVADGDRRVRSADETGAIHDEVIAPSIAHLVLASVLTDDELAALAAAPDTWQPETDRHAPRAEQSPWATRPRRPWLTTVVLALVSIVLGGPVLVACVVLTIRHAPFWILPVILLGGVIYVAFAGVHELLWLEPRARELRPDEHGIAHPTTGQRVPWETVRSVAWSRTSFRVRFDDGSSVVIPDGMLLDARAARRDLEARIARGGTGPYRRQSARNA